MPSALPVQKGKLIPELLAPAGSPESLRAAVAAGADAVYLSGKKFGARRSAPNFTNEEIMEAVRYAHRQDISIYVTLNTLIHDRELPAVAEYLIWLYSIGVDAVLVQDVGVAALARTLVPRLPLHASTQMTIHSPEGVLWAAEQGFSRVVLARELTLDDVTRISEETDESGIGLEVFVHGALCYSYSGQCLLSSVIGGRSGNRGMCAQPCRKPYTLLIGDADEYGLPTGLHEVSSPERYLLSPKDLCTYELLPTLVSSPIDSLKIEGRMKSPEYVAIVVSTYRRALDAIAAGKTFKDPKDLQDLCLAFNRGFTPGYLSGKRSDAVMGRGAPDNRGICVGVVNRYDEKSKTVTFRSNGSYFPAPGDGLCFTSPRDPGHEFGFSLNTVPQQKKDEVTLRVPRPVGPGTEVFVTSSTDLAARARQIITHPPVGLRHPVPIDLDVRIDTGGHLVLEGVVHTRKGHAIHLVYRSDFSLEPARSNPLTRQQLEQQLKKTGGTPFTIRSFTLVFPDNLFASLAELNRTRREFFRHAEEALAGDAVPSKEYVEQAWLRWNELKPAVVIQPPKTAGGGSSSSLRLGVFSDSPESVKKAVEAGCDVVYFEPVFIAKNCTCRHRTGVLSYESQVITASRLCREAGIRFVLKFPRITTGNYLDSVLPVLSGTLLSDISGIMVENCGTAHRVRQVQPALPLFGSTGLHVFNHETARHLASRFCMVTLSPELSREEIGLLILTARRQGYKLSFALVVQGSSEAMISEDCLLRSSFPCSGKKGEVRAPAFFGIRDMTGHLFPVRVDGECRSHIYNAAEICLIDHLPSLMQAGIDEVIIDARGRTGTYTGDMTALYREAIQQAKKGARTGDPGIEKLKNAIKRRAIGGITTGHFIRGLKEPD
jgi:putative protease